MNDAVTRRWLLTAERLLAYSRSGNFHSDPAEASKLGLTGMVAAGMQVAGPAYAAALDQFGDVFLERGEVELKFTGMVTDGHEVEARVTFDGAGRQAAIEVLDATTGETAVVGTARLV